MNAFLKWTFKKKKIIGNYRNTATCAIRLKGDWENYTAALLSFDTTVQKPGLVSPGTKMERKRGKKIMIYCN